jgi:hypothetical protein
MRKTAAAFILFVVSPVIALAAEPSRPAAKRRPSKRPAATAPKRDDRPDFFAGYSHVWARDTGLSGIEVAGSFPVGQRWRLALDVARESGSFAGADLRESHFMLGPGRVWRHDRLRPFARLLVGAVHDRSSVDTGGAVIVDSGTHLGLALAGGTDYMISPRWAIRGQLGLWFVHGNGETETDPHLSLGVVYRLRSHHS